MWTNEKRGICYKGELIMTKGGMDEEKAESFVNRLNEKEKGKEKTHPTDQSSDVF